MGDFYEFFAGGGMARAGLGRKWRCLFANDIDAKKAAAYQANWGETEFRLEDIALLSALDLPEKADLVWASFPCQDLSLAGAGAGLRGERSGTFWPFWRLMTALQREGRGPKIVVLENVCGALTSHQGKDFAAIGEALADAEYQFGAVVVDAAEFVPQSRPRLFIIAARDDLDIGSMLLRGEPDAQWHTPALVTAVRKLSPKALSHHVWWRLPMPPARKSVFADLIEDEPEGVTWHTAAETRKLVAMMSPINLRKLDDAKRSGEKKVGAIYKRTRLNEDGVKVQRAEIRFDDMAGCLRTPVGGSSRQTIMIVNGSSVRSRLISPRETARLMGLPDTYRLPKNYNEAYHLTGDGVVVSVVRHIEKHLLQPLNVASELSATKAA